MLDWMVELLGLPDRFRSTGAGGGVIQGTASEATLCAILAARERATAGAGNRPARRRSGRLRHVPGALVDREGAADRRHRQREPQVVAHDDASRCDRRRWRRPSPRTGPPGGARSSSARRPARRRSTAFDPVPALAAICRREGLWLHVDAAMAGIAALCPSCDGSTPGWSGRLVLHQPAQVDGRQLRLRPVLGGRPGRAPRRAVDPARVPAHRGGRGGRGDRLPRLADPPGPAVPGAQAVVHAAHRRRRRRSRP